MTSKFKLSHTVAHEILGSDDSESIAIAIRKNVSHFLTTKDSLMKGALEAHLRNFELIDLQTFRLSQEDSAEWSDTKKVYVNGRCFFSYSEPRFKIEDGKALCKFYYKLHPPVA